MPDKSGKSNEKKGFTGLSDLASEVNITDDPIKPEPKIKPKPSTPNPVPSIPKQPQPLMAKREDDPKRKDADTGQTIKNRNTGNNAGGSSGKWIIGIVGLVIVLWLVNLESQSSKNPSHRPQTTNTTQSAELQFTKPSIGDDNMLSTEEIRWCLREYIRIETMRDIINEAGINEFNLIVNDYNIRCASYRYREGSQSHAERDIEAQRRVIVSEAIIKANQLGRQQPTNPSVSLGAPSNTISHTQRQPKLPDRNHASREVVIDAQNLLTRLGYSPGPADGSYGPKTAQAVMLFQRDSGLREDGIVDDYLVGRLRLKIMLRGN